MLPQCGDLALYALGAGVVGAAGVPACTTLVVSGVVFEESVVGLLVESAALIWPAMFDTPCVTTSVNVLQPESETPSARTAAEIIRVETRDCMRCIAANLDCDHPPNAARHQ